MRGRWAGRRTAAARQLTTTDDRGLVLIAAKCIQPNALHEWRRWHHEHLSSLVGGRIADASVWSLDGAPPPGGPGAGHSHVTRIDVIGPIDAAVEELDARVAQARTRGDVHPGHGEIRRDVWIAHGSPVAATEDEAITTGLITAEVLCTDPAKEAEWDAWYDEQHLPDMLGTGAFASGSRWTRHPRRTGGANHLTVYEIAGMPVAAAVARSAASMPALVERGRKHDSHTGGLTMALSRESAE